MAIKNLFGRGVGFGAIHWIVTRGYDAGAAPPTPVVAAEPEGGGRRIYDPDEHRKKYRPLSKRERSEIDRMFRDRVAPRYVQPTTLPVVVTKRTTPVVIPAPLPVPGFVPPPVDRVQAAKHFLALDALEGLFDRIEPERAVVAHHRAALANAERLRVEMARAAEQERMDAEQRAADEDEMMMVLLYLHEADE